MKADYAVRFATALGVLGDVFNEPVTDIRTEAYFAALEDLDGEAVLKAMHDCTRESKFFPRPAEIRERVKGKSEDRAELAWGALLKEIRRVGYMGWPTLPEPTMDAIKAVWGNWRHLCETLPGEGPELLGWRKAFVAAYGAEERESERLRLESGVPLTSRDQLAPSVRAFIQQVIEK